ncbi:unnamed protein product [Acanthosepion pharaonis]|uniref:Uncharacterized protein n=1 Tax=Acanthosepion pharaonis TaxID=158019 RepID=A0A812DSB0_ACAPH|nr:unnamed protein product [Sepia pharaonis]
MFSFFNSLHLPVTIVFSSVSLIPLESQATFFALSVSHLIHAPFPCSPYHFCHNVFPFHSLHLPATIVFSSVSHHLIQAPFPCSPHHFCHNVFPFHSLHLPATICPTIFLVVPFSSVSHHLIQAPFPCGPYHFSTVVPPLDPSSFFLVVPTTFATMFSLFHSLHLPATRVFSSVSHHLIQEPFPCSPHHICHNVFPFHSLHLPATIVFSSVSHHLIQAPFPCSPYHFCHNVFLFIPYICLPQLHFPQCPTT